MLRKLKLVAAHWGWNDLKRRRHTMPKQSPNPGKQIVWYESGLSTGGRNDLFLQINECPIGQQVVYAAAVYAPRYRLNSGWHLFKLPAGTAQADDRIKELSAWLHWCHFESANARRTYRAAHPEAAGYSWKRIAEIGPPWEIVDAVAMITRLNPRIEDAN
jgi:hypothetical protein